MKTLIRALLVVLVILLMASCATTGTGVPEYVPDGKTMKEVLDGKVAIRRGGCYFRNGAFMMFATGTWMSPEKTIERRRCTVFVLDKSLNPAWLLLFDAKGKPEKIIEWRDAEKPGETPNIKSVWVDGTGV